MIEKRERDVLIIVVCRAISSLNPIENDLQISVTHLRVAYICILYLSSLARLDQTTLTLWRLGGA